MSGRQQRLARLLAIRQLSEDINRRSLQLALASVAQVEAAIASQEVALSESKVSARAALTVGDRSEWLMADAQTEVAGWNRERLNALLQKRSSDVVPAMEKFLESRLEHEQVRQLVDDARNTAREAEHRKSQAAADDWFLGKRMFPSSTDVD